MPRVPVAERTVETAPLRGGQLSQAPSGAFGGMERVFSEVERIMAEEKKKADQLAVLDGDVKNSAFETSLLYDPQQGLLTRRGKDARGIYDEARTQWDAHVAATEKGLASEAQRLAYRNRAVSRWADIDRQLQRHMAEEGRRYDDTVTESFIANERTSAALNYQDAERVKTSIDTQKAVLVDHARRNGLPAEWLKLKTSEVAGKTHKAVLDRMIVNGQDEAAQAYYEANKVDFADTEMEAKLAKASSEGTAARAADEIWASIGPRKPGDPVNVFKMVEAIREKHGESEDVMKAAAAQVKERAALWSAEVQQNKDANEAAVWRAVEKGTDIASVRAMPEYQALPGDRQVTVKNHIVDRAHALASRRDDKPTDSQWSAFWQHSQPDELNAMSEDQVQNLLPKLGRRLTNDLMAKKRSMGKAEVLEATIDSDLFKELADEAGLKAFKAPSALTERQRAELGNLRAGVEAAIATEQAGRGRKLTRDEKEAVMRRVIEKTVTVKSGWFGTAEKPAAAVRREDFEKIVVPDEDRAKIKDALKRANMPVTEAEIKRLYMQKVNLAR